MKEPTSKKKWEGELKELLKSHVGKIYSHTLRRSEMKAIKKAFASHTQALCEEVEKLHPIYDINDRPHVSRDDILALLKAKI